MSFSSPRRTILLFGTCDTKLDELLFLKARLKDDISFSVKLIDVGRHAIKHPHIDASLCKHNPPNASRNDVIETMGIQATNYIRSIQESDPDLIHGVMAIGGSGGTSIAAKAMRDALPIGFPKLIVSTMAS